MPEWKMSLVEIFTQSMHATSFPVKIYIAKCNGGTYIFVSKRIVLRILQNQFYRHPFHVRCPPRNPSPTNLRVSSVKDSINSTISIQSSLRIQRTRHFIHGIRIFTYDWLVTINGYTNDGDVCKFSMIRSLNAI